MGCFQTLNDILVSCTPERVNDILGDLGYRRFYIVKFSLILMASHQEIKDKITKTWFGFRLNLTDNRRRIEKPLPSPLDADSIEGCKVNLEGFVKTAGLSSSIIDFSKSEHLAYLIFRLLEVADCSVLVSDSRFYGVPERVIFSGPTLVRTLGARKCFSDLVRAFELPYVPDDDYRHFDVLRSAQLRTPV